MNQINKYVSNYTVFTIHKEMWTKTGQLILCSIRMLSYGIDQNHIYAHAKPHIRITKHIYSNFSTLTLKQLFLCDTRERTTRADPTDAGARCKQLHDVRHQKFLQEFITHDVVQVFP